MQRGINRFVISRENNVVRVDFSRHPDPPAPRFPGASGLREIGYENARDTKSFAAKALRAASVSFFNVDSGQCNSFCSMGANT